MKRRWFLLSACLVFLAGLWILGAHPRDLIPSVAGQALAWDFATTAFLPALDFEAADMRAEGVSFPTKVFTCLLYTSPSPRDS